MKFLGKYIDIGKIIYSTSVGYFSLNRKNLSRLSMLIGVVGIEIINAYMLYELAQYSGLLDESLKKGFNDVTKASLQYMGAQIILIISETMQTYLLDSIAESLSKAIRDDITVKMSKHRLLYFMSLNKEWEYKPEQIVQDVEDLTSTTVHTAYGLARLPIRFISSLSYLIIWSGILPAYYMGRVIRGYMAYPVIAFGLLSNTISAYLSEPFKTIYSKFLDVSMQYRAMFNFINKNSLAISAMRGENYESNSLSSKSKELHHVFKQNDITTHMMKTWKGFNQSLQYILTAILVWPKFQANEMGLAGFSMVKGQITNLIDSINFLNNNPEAIATAKVQHNRITEFYKNINKWQEFIDKRNVTIKYNQSTLSLADFSISIPKQGSAGDSSSKQLLLKGVECVLQKGRCYRVAGKSGSGKSIFLRAIFDLWPYTEGKISYPASSIGKMSYVTQDPLDIVQGRSLLEHIAYPNSVGSIDQLKVRKLMKQWDMEEHIVNIKAENFDWGRVLSGGERQKISIISALVKKPELLIMDESMSQLDYKSKLVIQKTIKEELPKATILFVDHTPNLGKDAFHDAEIKLIDKQLVVENVKNEPVTQKRPYTVKELLSRFRNAELHNAIQ